MASPDTDELPTVPRPAGAPEGRGERAEPDGTDVPQARAEPGSDRASAEARERVSAAARAAEVPGRAAARTEAPSAAEAATVEQERVEPERIEPDRTAPAAPPRPGGRWWRGFTGSLAAGLTVLAAGVVVVAVICLFTGAPGPGATLLIGHPIAAALALVAQRVADRRNGPAAVGAGTVVVLFAVSAVTLFWLT
ncbi:hypothetical protein [Amycolatopsis sp. lyj-23]|uniref:hypothetical protein n=1 Tax=Amycolatopsis sp. lyj-23 TaxID=2789283 RepID=UPI003978F363